MHYISVIFLTLAVVISADIPLPPEFEEPEFRSTENSGSTTYRLPEDLDPEHYDVEITPYFTATANREAFTFDGIVTITVKALKDEINALIIHENVREIVSVTLTNEAGAAIQLRQDNVYDRLHENHFLRVNLADGVTLVKDSKYILTVTYIGNINETPLSRGVFRGSHRDANGNIRWYAATHLQPTNSRQAFPGFDEPGFKSTFRIIINRPTNFVETYSNMRVDTSSLVNGRIREVFQVTPRMSAYLVTFHISEDFGVIADNNDNQKSYRILARPTAQGQGAYALEVGPPITQWLSDYLGIDYYSMATNIKNDQIASPYWASGATENWGLVTYRELRLLYQEGETNALDKMYIGTITAHELAHKWFGNLITCRWWDNVWINEGFASYFEYFAMDGVYPELELEDQFNIMYVQSALSADASLATRALQHTVNSPAEVTGHFSGISYSKGASLLLMLKHFVTENTFKKALNSFLNDRSYQHAFPSDLYSAFAKAVTEGGVLPNNVDIASFMKYWVEEPGYPVLEVSVNSAAGRIELSQKRFLISATAVPTEQVWPLPLTYTTESNPDWQNLLPSKVMTTKTDSIERTLSPNEWIIFNVQQKGIYRVNYDTNNWQLLANALNNDHTAIHHLNRAQIVDDVFALMRSEQLSYQVGFRVLEFLKKDTSYYSWYPAISGFNWLRNRFLHLPATLAEFDKIIFGFLDAVLADLGYDVTANEPLTKTLNRFFTLSFACNIGHKGCVEDAVQKFTALRQNNVAVNPNLRRHVFCEGLRAGGLDEWQYLYNRRQASNNQGDEIAMLRSLGCTSNDQARQLYLQMILDDDVVKAQDRTNAFSFLYMGDRSNARVGLQFIKANVDQIRKAVVLSTWFNTVLTTTASYLDEEGLKDMEEWLLANQDTVPEYSVGISAINSARANMQWGTNNAATVIAAANNEEPSVPEGPGSGDEGSGETGPGTEGSGEGSGETGPGIEGSGEGETGPGTDGPGEEETTTEPEGSGSGDEGSGDEGSGDEGSGDSAEDDKPGSAAIFLPTTMILSWAALAVLLQ